MAELRWRDWDDEVFEEARAMDRPLLLFLKASWCRFCREIEESVLSKENVIQQIAENYVPVRVDKDRRPEIDRRYNLGGWPTLAVLTPDGELFTGGSDLSAEEVEELIAKAADHYQQNRETIEVGIDTVLRRQEEVDQARLRHSGELSESIVGKVAAAILDAFDRRYGGFGTGQKFPHPEALDFAILHYAKTRDAAYGELVQKTLASMAAGKLFDSVSGAYFRYCGTRDWRQPHTEVLLETQAGLLRNYIEAYQLFRRDDFRRAAQRILGFLESTLYDPETGAYFGSQDQDDEYYWLEERRRQDRKPPRVERTIYTPSVAMTISSLFKAGSALGDEKAHRRALGALHFLLERCYSPGRGMYHYFDGTRHILGLLTDQIYTARAVIHAVQYTGDNDYLPILEDLVGTILKKQAATDGGFYDISEDDAKFGSLRRRNTSLAENGAMAEILLRAHCLTGASDYRGIAERTLQAFAADYQRYGYFIAGYARAIELYYRQPVQVVVVGPQSDPVRARMLAAAQETFVPSKVVLAIDPKREPELLEVHQFPVHATPRTYVCLARACVAELDDPAKVPEAMAAAEERR